MFLHVNATGQPCRKVFPGQPWETRYLSYTICVHAKTKENRNQTTLMTCTGIHTLFLLKSTQKSGSGGCSLKSPALCSRAASVFWQLPQCIFWGVAVIPSPIPSVSHIMPACILYSSIYPHLPLWQCCDLGRKPRWSLFLLELLWSSLRRAHPQIQ